VLYMKGSPVFPQCGFSAAVVQILSHLGVKFKASTCCPTRGSARGIKEFSNCRRSAALCQGRVRWRLRHHPRDVRDR
jgi:glutaredoxin-related protein